MNGCHRRLRLRSCRAQRLCKTSRDPLASVKAKRVVKLSSMTSQQRVTTCNGNTISLPRFLHRPPPKPIQVEALLNACPELDDVSDGFVRTHLTSMAPKYVSPLSVFNRNAHCSFLYSMLAGVESTRIIRGNTSELPSQLPVLFDDSVTMPTVAPTHILALSTPTQPDRSTLFLIHQLPFAANCSAFPALPRSSTESPAGNRSTTATLPVIRASLPSIDAFPLFQIYLYVKDPEALRVTFLPSGWAHSMDSIMHSAVLIKGFWSNAYSFGTLDDAVFDVVDECWAEVLRMLDRATR
jgi:hypothetical protein